MLLKFHTNLREGLIFSQNKKKPKWVWLEDRTPLNHSTNGVGVGTYALKNRSVWIILH